MGKGQRSDDRSNQITSKHIKTLTEIRTSPSLEDTAVSSSVIFNQQDMKTFTTFGFDLSFGEGGVGLDPKLERVLRVQSSFSEYMFGVIVSGVLRKAETSMH